MRVVTNPILLMFFERYGIYDRWYEEWSSDGFRLVFMTGFAESHILSWKKEWQGFTLGGMRLRGADQLDLFEVEAKKTGFRLLRSDFLAAGDGFPPPRV